MKIHVGLSTPDTKVNMTLTLLKVQRTFETDIIVSKRTLKFNYQRREKERPCFTDLTYKRSVFLSNAFGFWRGVKGIQYENKIIS